MNKSEYIRSVMLALLQSEPRMMGEPKEVYTKRLLAFARHVADAVWAETS